MRKKILSVMLVMALLIATCGVAVAADVKGGSTRSHLKSYGSIEYHNGDDKVVINADDLYMLADQIDQVKLDVADQLEAMNTYFTAGNGISLSTDDDISIAHSQPSRSDTVDPLSVNFDTMLEGIAASQSVSTDVTDYGYAAGTKLYMSVDGSLTTNGSEEGATQVTITAATAENLSAGTVAWVNGELILGTGGDNKSYFDLGSADNSNSSGPISGLSRVECINMRGDSNNGTIYTIQEDMTDVIFMFFGSAKKALSFESNEDVAYKEVYYKSVSGTRYTGCCTIYFIPELKRGTAVPNLNCNSYLVRIKEIGIKNGKITTESITGSTHYVSKDLKDVLLLQCGSNDDPAFQEAPDSSIVVFKKIVTNCFSRNGAGTNTDYYFNLYYIPELKEYSTIIKHSNGVLFY